MADKYQLIMAVFPDESAADRAVRDLKDWDKASEQIKLGSVGVLVKDEHGNIKQEKLGPRQTRKGAGIGLALGIVAAIPTAGLSLWGGALAGVLGGGALGALFQKGFKFSEEDAKRINKELDGGHAVVGVMATEYESQRVIDRLRHLGGSVESHEVTEEALKEAASATKGAQKKKAA